jgi:guanylate kinase
VICEPTRSSIEDLPEGAPGEGEAADGADFTTEALVRRALEPDPLVVVISGPSGVGKDETIKHMKARGRPFHFVVTATTRPRRANEVDGVDYRFVSPAEFAEMIERGELLEHALVYGDYKGIPKQQVRDALASGKDVILRIDIQGASTIRQKMDGAVFIFMIAESSSELERRLRERKSEPPDRLAVRIATARQELRRIGEFDYAVVNRRDRLDDTVDSLLAIIAAEKHRVRPRCIQL